MIDCNIKILKESRKLSGSCIEMNKQMVCCLSAAIAGYFAAIVTNAY